MKIIKCIKYEDTFYEDERTLAIVEVPKYVKGWPTENIAFVRSAGEISQEQFKGTFFPTGGIGKAQNEFYYTRPTISISDWYTGLTHEFKETYRIKEFFSNFLDWWMVRISAMFGGKTWDRMIHIKDFVLAHEWDRKNQKFFKITPLKPLYFLKCPEVDMPIDNINTWIRKNKGFIASQADLKNYYLYYMNVPSPKKKKTPYPLKSTKVTKVCPPDKILNPISKKCVKKTGKIGKKLLEEKIIPLKEEISPSKKKVSGPPPKKKISKKKGPLPKAKSTKAKSTKAKSTKAKSTKAKSTKAKSTKVKSTKVKSTKVCPPGKILNPVTGRCVLKTGKIGQSILKGK